MAKIVIRIPETRKEYTEDNQRQIKRTIKSLIEKLKSPNRQNNKEEQERVTLYTSK